MQTFNVKTDVSPSTMMFLVAGVAILSYVLGTFSGYYWKALDLKQRPSTKKTPHFKEETNSEPQVKSSNGNSIVSH